MTRLTIISPMGKSECSVDSSFKGTLLELLEINHFQLNTRCGGKGLCRGCRVIMETDADSETVRSCKLKLDALPDNLNSIIIPESSIHSQSIHGVSEFEINLKPHLPTRPGYGLAIDVGTTTVAANLWCYSDNQCLASSTRPNAQSRFGDNVISRIDYALENTEGLNSLKRTIVDETLRPLILDLCRKASLNPDQITEATAAGNPVMLHILAGKSLDGFARYPFKPIFLEKRLLDHGLPGIGKFPITLLPGLGPFVGSDITAGALAAGLLENNTSALLIDFGTNGELLLKHKDRVWATATAAGPAFEGGRLACGSTAGDRVIAALHYDKDAWNYSLCGAEHTSPTGITGSAYIDFLAESWENGLINEWGRFNPNAQGVEQWHVMGDITKGIKISGKTYITEPDIAELIQAKAAIKAGIDTLLELAGMDCNELDRVYIAGGFGFHLNLKNARCVGLIPRVPLEQIQVLGNAALGGASLLLHPFFQKALEPLLEQCTCIELNQTNSYEEHYIDAMSMVF